MSLKAFHIVFIIASVFLTLGFGAYELVAYFVQKSGTTMDLLMGLVSCVLAVALMVYGVLFLKKLRHISYL